MVVAILPQDCATAPKRRSFTPGYSSFAPCSPIPKLSSLQIGNEHEAEIQKLRYRAGKPAEPAGSQKNLVQRDRQLLAALRSLDKPSLMEHLSDYLDKFQIEGLLARRDKIVEYFEKAIAREGESAILYDYLPAKW
jgi:hypothetical protein